MRLGLWLVRIAAIVAFVLLILSHRPSHTILADFATDQGSSGANIAYVGLGPAVGDADLVCPIGIENLEPGRLAIIDRDTERVLSYDFATRGVMSAREFQIDRRFYVDGAIYHNKVLWLWVQDAPGSVHVALPLPSGGDGPFTMDGTLGPDRFRSSELGTIFWRAASPEVQRRLEAMGFPVPGVGRTPTLTRPELTAWSDSIIGPSIPAATAAPADSAAPSAPADPAAPAPAPDSRPTPPPDDPTRPPPAPPVDGSAPADPGLPPPPPPTPGPGLMQAAPAPAAPAPATSTAAPAPTPGAAGTYTLNYTLKNSHQLTIGVVGPDGPRQATIRAQYDIVFAQVLRVDDQGDVFVLVTSENHASRTYDVRQTVYRLRGSGGSAIAYDVPLQESACVPRQHLTVSPAGEVLFLRVLYDKVSLLRLNQRTWLSWFRDPWPLPQVASRLVEGTHAFLRGILTSAHAESLFEITDGAPIARREVLQNACKMVRFSWSAPDAPTVGTANDTLCSCDLKGGKKCAWKAPGNSPHKIAGTAAGTAFSGMAYGWGGFDRLGAFEEKMSRTGARRRPAGDVCTRFVPTDAEYQAAGQTDAAREAACPTRNGQHRCPKPTIEDPTPLSDPPNQERVNFSYSAGIDCSGFVMRAWGSNRPQTVVNSNGQTTLATKLNTRDLDNQAKLSAVRADNVPRKPFEKLVDYVDGRKIGGTNAKSAFNMKLLKPGDVMNDPTNDIHIRMFAAWWKKNNPTEWEIMQSSVECGGTCSIPKTAAQMRTYQPMRLRWIKDKMRTADGDPRNVPELTEADLPMCHAGF